MQVLSQYKYRGMRVLVSGIMVYVGVVSAGVRGY